MGIMTQSKKKSDKSPNLQQRESEQMVSQFSAFLNHQKFEMKALGGKKDEKLNGKANCTYQNNTIFKSKKKTSFIHTLKHKVQSKKNICLSLGIA